MRIALALFFAAFALCARAEDWTVAGKTYQNVSVTSVDSSEVHIMYDGGIGSLALADLPPDLQKRFGYDPAQAKSDANTASTPLEVEEKADAGKILIVNVGNAAIQLSCPPGMSDVPPNDPLIKAQEDLTPPDWQRLRTCISSQVLDASQPLSKSDDNLTIESFAMKDFLMDIDSGNFIDAVEGIAFHASLGVFKTQDEVVDDAEIQKRLDQFQKDTGVTLQASSAVYSLGLISRSVACVAYMTAQCETATYEGKSERVKCVSVCAYIHLKNKVIVAVTSLNKPLVLHDDLLVLKRAAEKYQIELQLLNNT